MVQKFELIECLEREIKGYWDAFVEKYNEGLHIKLILAFDEASFLLQVFDKDFDHSVQGVQIRRSLFLHMRRISMFLESCARDCLEYSLLRSQRYLALAQIRR